MQTGRLSSKEIVWMGMEYYGKEPFDLKLTVLLLWKRFYFVTVVTILGMLLFGGGYWLKNVCLRGQDSFQTVSTYRVDYSVADEQVGQVVINEMTWNTYVHTKEFLTDVRQVLAQSAENADTATLTDEEIGAMLVGRLESDWRVPSTVVTGTSSAAVLQVAAAVEQVMTQSFPEGVREISSIRVIDPAVETEPVIPDVRPVRAFVLSGILSLLAAICFVLLQEIYHADLYLPITISQRYGLKTVGTVQDPFFKENMRYLFGNAQDAVIVPVQQDTDLKQVQEIVTHCFDEAGKAPSWTLLPEFTLCPPAVEKCRQAQAVLLVVKAGKHSAASLEKLLEYLNNQDCSATAVLLWQADQKMIERYYQLGRRQTNRKGVTE